VPYANPSSESKTYCYRPTCVEAGQPCALTQSGDPDAWELKPDLLPFVNNQCQIVKEVKGGVEFKNYRETILATYVQGTLGARRASGRRARAPGTSRPRASASARARSRPRPR
jgi:hypothetical protein